MLTFLLIPALLGCCASGPAPEPDGSRTLGIVPPFRGQPAPPRWLRGTSHAVAAAGGSNTRHYLYEAYGDGHGGWLVRYLHYPDANEPVAEAEQDFLFSSDPLGKPRNLQPAEIQFEPRNARWQGRAFTLVDRRDLVRP